MVPAAIGGTLTVLAIIALVLLVLAANGLWLLSIRYAAERKKVESPGGNRYDVLVHRQGVMLYTKAAGVANLYSLLPTVIALVRRWRRGPWRWTVTVRVSPFAGNPDLLHEEYGTVEDARRRASAIEAAVSAGNQMWPSS